METPPRSPSARLRSAALPLLAAGALALALAATPGLRAAGALALALAGIALATSGSLALRATAREREEERSRETAHDLASLAPGPAVAEGTVAPGPERQLAPLSRDRCVWYDVRMERLGRASDGTWGWVLIARETRGSPFEIDDGSARVRARPASDAALEGLHRFESVNPAHERVREWRERHVRGTHGGGVPDDALANQGLELRFIELRLKVGDAVRVHGHASRLPDGLALDVRHARPAAPRAPDRIAARARPRGADAALVALGLALVAIGASALAGHAPDAPVRAIAELALP